MIHEEVETWCCVNNKSLFLLGFLAALYLLSATFSTGKVNAKVIGSSFFFTFQTHNKLGGKARQGVRVHDCESFHTGFARNKAHFTVRIVFEFVLLVRRHE